MRISENGRYALVRALFTTASGCESHGFNGYELFRRTPPGWTRVFVGSDPPPCSYAVPRDLASCLKTIPPGPNYLAAARHLQSLGYTPRSSTWDEEQELNELLAAHAGRERVFFFSRGKLLGSDSADGSAHVTLGWRGDSVFALDYRLSGAGCTRVGEVRFVFRANRLVLLDPLPPSDVRSRCHR